jgi:hypothetical protein
MYQWYIGRAPSFDGRRQVARNFLHDSLKKMKMKMLLLTLLVCATSAQLKPADSSKAIVEHIDSTEEAPPEKEKIALEADGTLSPDGEKSESRTSAGLDKSSTILGNSGGSSLGGKAHVGFAGAVAVLVLIAGAAILGAMSAIVRRLFRTNSVPPQFSDEGSLVPGLAIL